MEKPAGNQVWAVLLAAGQSRRLGQPKQLLNLKGEPLVRRSARAVLGAGFGGVVAVVPPGALGQQLREVLSGLPLTFTECLAPEQGLSESFRAGLRALPPGAAAAHFTLADMPLLRAEHHRMLRTTFELTRAPLVLARYGFGADFTSAPPHLFRRDLFDGFTHSGDTGPRHLLRQYAAEAVYTELPSAALHDVDTWADWQALQTLV